MSFTKVAPAGIGTEPGTSIRIGDSLLHSIGIDLGSGTGIGASITRQGNATFTGIVTASAFFGDGSGLEGVSSSGIGTPLSDDDTSGLNKIYYVNQELSIGSTITVNHPDSAVASYTHYADIRLEEDADLIIEDGDDVIPDILGLGTDGGGLGAGGSGRIRVDSITNKNANGAPNFPNGLTGTAGTFTGNLNVAGVLTYEDVTNVDSIGIVTARSGIIVSSGSSIGIGTINATELLDIHSDSSAELRLYTKDSSSNATLNLRAGNSGNSIIEFGDTADDNVGELKYVHSNNVLQYSYFSQERIRIGPLGQIGIEGANYGQIGQVLKSKGASDAPEWAGYPRQIGNSTASGQGGFVYNTIPAYATKITVVISQLSLSGTNTSFVQLGTSSGFITSGYYSQTTNGEGSKINITNGFNFYTTGAGHAYSGAMTIYKVNDSRYSYTYTSTTGSGANRMGAGTLTGISGTIDRLQIDKGASNTFDNGVITIYAE